MKVRLGIVKKMDVGFHEICQSSIDHCFFGEMAWKPTFGSGCYAAGWWKRIVVLRELLLAS